MTEPHLSDDRLIELCVAGQIPAEDRAHLEACTRCEMRKASIVDILDELDRAATEEADAAFPPERLQRQQVRIFQRIMQYGRPGRLLAFPSSAPPTTTFRSRPHLRWAAAAAAAAFMMGMLAGHLVHDLPLQQQMRASQLVANDANPGPIRAVPTTFSEDEFLGQIELAAARNGPVALRPLDAMTPRAWDVAPR